MVFNWILNKIAGDYNQRQINKILPIVDKINEYFNEFESLSDDDIRAKTLEFKNRLANGETLDDILPEAFAVVKQGCKRMIGKEFEVKGQMQTWDMVPYDVQLIGGIVLHKGKISEMQTGEGKTLVATLPAYLNALEGKGVHVVTVNDYLASRDAQWMGYLYEFLGLTCGSITKNTSLSRRRQEYEKDITYVENSELGFDYLRDNLTKTVQQRSLTWRPLNYAIVDEVDSILIDEARTPLIISQPSGEATEKYVHYARIVKLLVPSKSKKKVSKGFLAEVLNDDKTNENADQTGDYYIDEKTKTVSLSSEGIQRLEGILGVENLYKDLGYEEIHHIENALKAQAVYLLDKDYMVRDGEVLIVDENTGRVMPGRRYSEGLHQAIEAKESVEIQRESQTLATITYQHFFKLYNKLSGMTGTANTEGEEFEKIYNLEVLSIPTNKSVIRSDKNDRVYFSKGAKFKALSDNIKFYHEIGVPMLIGTASIDLSEYVSTLLRSLSIQHYVLNAKYHEQEANIVSNAGKKGSVVVATNMAGRGTDIKLEKGLLPEIASNYAKWMQKTISSKDAKSVGATIYSETEFDLTMDAIKQTFGIADEQIRLAEKDWTKINDFEFKIKFNTSKKNKNQPFAEIYFKPQGNPEMLEKEFHYGLMIIGTEKHESRRIDNQLRGRSGRQGDPGSSQFYVALDDEIMRKMGGEKIQSIARMLLPASELETLELTQSQFTSSISRAQTQMEGWNFSIRKHLFDYDSVINVQRQKIYKTRDEILFSAENQDYDIIGEIKSFVQDVMASVVTLNTADSLETKQAIVENLNQICGPVFQENEFQDFRSERDIIDYAVIKISEIFDKKIESFENKEFLNKVLKDIYLETIDRNWVNNIDDLQYLRERVSMYSYAQQDPLVVYKKESYEKFMTLLKTIKTETLSIFLKTEFGINQDIDLSQINSEQEVINLLENISQNISPEQLQQAQQNTASSKEIQYQDSRAKIFEKNNDFEVIEIIEDNNSNKNISSSQATGKKVKPNDPCPCGSGKKYKKCCGKNNI